MKLININLINTSLSFSLRLYISQTFPEAKETQDITSMTRDHFSWTQFWICLNKKIENIQIHTYNISLLNTL